MSTEWVRVRDERTGHHYTVTKAKAEGDKSLKVIDAPAVDINGHTLPPKPHQTLAEVAAPKTAPKEAK